MGHWSGLIDFLFALFLILSALQGIRAQFKAGRGVSLGKRDLIVLAIAVLGCVVVLALAACALIGFANAGHPAVGFILFLCLATGGSIGVGVFASKCVQQSIKA